MKAAIIAGCVVLLVLAAPRAHAGTERTCPAYKLADGKWNTSEVMECKARIGRTIKSKESGHWVFNDPPPPEFDKPYEGVVGILRLPFVDAQKICRVGIYACSWVKQQPILQLGDRTVCYIVISLDDDLAQRSE